MQDGRGRAALSGVLRMPEGTTINAFELFSDDASEFFTDAGAPRNGRRLTDKVLAAFNHAYAMGEKQLARSLWDCLVRAEKLGQHFNRRPANEALELAAEWIAFIDARDRHHAVSRDPMRSMDEVSETQRAMRSAYQSWRARNLSADQTSESPASAFRE